MAEPLVSINLPLSKGSHEAVCARFSHQFGAGRGGIRSFQLRGRSALKSAVHPERRSQCGFLGRWRQSQEHAF